MESSQAAQAAFNGKFIADGALGVDVISGDSYRKGLIGGDIVTSGSETAASGLGIDIRSSHGRMDAYANPNAGKALINNFTVREDAIVLSGAETDYNVNINSFTTGTRRRPQTSTVVEIRSASTNEVIVSFSGSAFSSTTTAADPNIHYGITTTPAGTFIKGQQLFV